MTTIAYRDGVLAADTMVSRDGMVSGYTVKVERRGPIFAAYAGNCAMGQAFLDWFRKGMKGDPPPMVDGDCSCAGILIADDAIIEWSGQPRPDWIKAPFAAWGSGAQFALGAMAFGATAESAVYAAMTLDHGTGGRVTALRR